MNEKISIALADDHTMFRRGLVAILKAYNEVEVLFDAANGKELIEKIAAAKTKPQVCIIDVNMPIMHGYDTVKNIKANYPDILMLALSMYNDETNIIQMLRAGAHGYVVKDSEPTVLVEAIKTVKERGFYNSELITSHVLNNLKQEDKKSTISAQELIFLKYVCNEMTYKEIALEMDIAERTVDGYRDKLFEKLHVKSRVGLVIYALQNGIVDRF